MEACTQYDMGASPLILECGCSVQLEPQIRPNPELARNQRVGLIHHPLEVYGTLNAKQSSDGFVLR